MAETLSPVAINSVEPLDDSFAFQHSSPQSLRQSSAARSTLSYDHHQDTRHNYNFSATRYADEEEDAYITENNDTDHDDEEKVPAERLQFKRCTSSRSSISSFPASVIHNSLLISDHEGRTRNSSKSPLAGHYKDRSRSNTPVHKPMSPGREYLTGFRNPSSVLAMQMRESDFDDSDNPASAHRRHGSRMSHYSRPGSAQSSPTKRSGRSIPTSPRKSSSKLKREFPLVLLHCTLLPAAVAAHGPLVTEELLEAVLPEEYRERWKTLQDKVNRNSEVRSRGILIPHPKDDYELLEERLLESLELQRPRIRQNHFLGKEGNGTDSGFESSSQTEEDEDHVKCDKCGDCGKDLSGSIEQERKWVIKVFAANGLMRAGAWGAAWSEMEKVDVEVGVWMPEEVRREVDARLAALQVKAEEDLLAEEIRDGELKSGQTSEQNERMREIYGNNSARRQDEIDGLLIEPKSEHQTQHIPTPPVQQEISQLIATRVRAIAQDQRNVFIVFLSLLVLFFAMSRSPSTKIEPTAQLQPPLKESPIVHVVTTTMFATNEATYTTTVVASPINTIRAPGLLDVDEPYIDTAVIQSARPSSLQTGQLEFHPSAGSAGSSEEKTPAITLVNVDDAEPTPSHHADTEGMQEATKDQFETRIEDVVTGKVVASTSTNPINDQANVQDVLEENVTGEVLNDPVLKTAPLDPTVQ